MMEHFKKLSESENAFACLTSLANSMLKDHLVVKLVKPGIESKFNPLIDLSPHPTIMVPMGDDGSASHCIAMIDNMILESNHKNAVELSSSVLDYCVSTSTKACKYIRPMWAFRCIPLPPKIPSFQKKNSSQCHEFGNCCDF